MARKIEYDLTESSPDSGLIGTFWENAEFIQNHPIKVPRQNLFNEGFITIRVCVFNWYGMASNANDTRSKNLTTIEVEVSKFASKPVIGNEEKTRDVFRAVDYYPITCLEVMFLFGYFFAKSFNQPLLSQTS